MKQIKVSEATPTQLDWLVAKCVNPSTGMVRIHEDNKGAYRVTLHAERGVFAPTTNWAQGGPIITEHIGRLEEVTAGGWEAEAWGHISEASTDLVAVCRCYVTNTLGEIVEVPDEL